MGFASIPLHLVDATVVIGKQGHLMLGHHLLLLVLSACPKHWLCCRVLQGQVFAQVQTMSLDGAETLKARICLRTTPYVL